MALIEIINRLDNIKNDGKSKLSKTNNTAYNGLNRKIKKAAKEFDADIERVKQKKDNDLGQPQKQTQEKEPDDPLDYLDSSGDE